VTSSRPIQMLTRMAVSLIAVGVALIIVGLILRAHFSAEHLHCELGEGFNDSCGGPEDGVLAAGAFLVVGAIMILGGLFNLARNAVLTGRLHSPPKTLPAAPRTPNTDIAAAPLPAPTLAHEATVVQNEPRAERSVPPAAGVADGVPTCDSCRQPGSVAGDRCYSCGGIFI